MPDDSMLHRPNPYIDAIMQTFIHGRVRPGYHELARIIDGQVTFTTDAQEHQHPLTAGDTLLAGCPACAQLTAMEGITGTDVVVDPLPPDADSPSPLVEGLPRRMIHPVDVE